MARGCSTIVAGEAELCPFHEARGSNIDLCLSHYGDGLLPISDDDVGHRFGEGHDWSERHRAATGSL